MRATARARAGFTLLEMLVVLAIAGLLASVALPQMQTIARSVEIANQRRDLQIAIEGLGYQAYASGKPIELAGEYPRAGSAPPAIRVPEGWRVVVAEPIRFGVNGVCGGGVLTLAAPDGTRERFALKAPQCRLGEPVRSE